MGRDIVAKRKAMIAGNVSFVPKPPKGMTTEEEKFKYVQSALNDADINEASAMDALNAFDKYGKRIKYGEGGCENTMTDLTVAVYSVAEKLDNKTVNEVLDKYLDLFNKFADITPPSSDTRNLGWLLENHGDKMSKDTVLKFIETLKKFSFERSQAWDVRKYILEDEFTKRSPEDLAEIEKHLDELDAVVKDLPFIDKTREND